MKNNFSNQWMSAMAACCVIAGLGCAGTARSNARIEQKLAEESRALTTAVVEGLQMQPAEQNDQYTATALEFARQDQRVEGLPVRPFDVGVLLGTNLVSQEIVREEIRERVQEQNELLGRQRELQGKLMSLGAVADEKEARRTRSWAKWISFVTLLTGGVVALCVFFPVAIPIVGRVLAWLVGKLPGLAGAVGVVGVKAFDAVVKGIEKARQVSAGVDRTGAPAVLKERAVLPNEDSRRPSGPIGNGAEWLAVLEENLSRTMDADHKRLVKNRKLAAA